MHDLIRQELGAWKIEDLPVPFFCLSSDLVNFELVRHDRGELWTAVRASGSVPGIGPPLFLAGRMLVDGATINGTPVDIFRQRFNGYCVLVDVSRLAKLDIAADTENVPSGWSILWRRLWPFATSIQLPGLAEIFLRSLFVSSYRRTKANLVLADVVISPPAAEIGLLEFDALDTLIEIGYGAAVRQFPDMVAGPLGRFIKTENLPEIDTLPTAASLIENYKSGRRQRRWWRRSISRALIIAGAAGLVTGFGGGLWNGTLIGTIAFLVTLGALFAARIWSDRETMP